MEASRRSAKVLSINTQENIADIFAACKEAILKNWEQKVLRALPAARHKNRSALRDHLPQFFEQIKAALEAGKVPDELAKGGRTEGAEHGRQRSYLEGYTLNQVLTEFRLFKDAILEVLSKEVTITKQTTEVICEITIQGVCDTANEFARTHLEREKISKHKLEEDRALRERFVLTLSHDLRNPLTAIKTSLRLIRKYPEKMDAHEHLLSQIDKGVDRATQMIDDLLDANQIHAGKQLPLVLAPCELNLIAEEVIEELSLQYESRFTFHAPSSVWGIWSSTGLRRIIENLLNNAVKYGDPQRKISLTIVEHPSNVVLTVHNWGLPIKQDQQINLFAPFQRAETSLKSGVKGWGLGLTIVRGITESLGGKISVRSTIDEGTFFAVTLPLNSRPYQNH